MRRQRASSLIGNVHRKAPINNAPEVLATPGASFLGSGGGDSRAAFGCEGFATRSVARNPRPTGYERGRGIESFFFDVAMLRS